MASIHKPERFRNFSYKTPRCMKRLLLKTKINRSPRCSRAVSPGMLFFLGRNPNMSRTIGIKASTASMQFFSCDFVVVVVVVVVCFSLLR